jgi:hypothetical protein
MQHLGDRLHGSELPAARRPKRGFPWVIRLAPGVEMKSDGRTFCLVSYDLNLRRISSRPEIKVIVIIVEN